jgi:uncharacterized membrane protein YgdD (TMEM256/DUF423 family)
LLGFGGVAAGAFGAHGLEGPLPADALATWELAARYQLVHAAVLVGVGLLIDRSDRAAGTRGSRRGHTALRIAAIALTAGVVVFSGSLYVLAATGIGWLGAITPIGGTALLVGWAALAVGVWRGG